jgi:hypothetical protein
MWKQSFASYFAIVGITFFIEWLILVIFKGYSYYPMMMKKAFDDIMMGNVVSQTLISSIALLIVVFDLKYIWFIIFSIVLSLIEVLFKNLGIYEQHWYKTWFTSLGLVGYFWIVKRWVKKTIHSTARITQHTALLLSTFSVYSPCVEWTLRILGIYQFKVNFLSDPDPIRNHINDYVVYIFFILNLIIVLYKSKLNFIWQALGITMIYFINYVLVKLDILYIKTNWFLIYSTIVTLTNYLLVVFFDYMFNFKDKNQK